jgi:uncharacterized lipoprotein YajG
MKSFRYSIILFLSFLLLGCAKPGTHFLLIRYQPVKEFSSLRQKIGPVLALVPFKDERPDTLYIGRHTSLQGITSFFKTGPSSLEKAIQESLSQVLSRYGIKTVSHSKWDGKPESLKEMETDSILMIEIKKFWIEGKAATFRTNADTSIHLVIHLGVKREEKVFIKNVEVEKEATFARLTPERVEEVVNQALTDILDSFLASPY